MSDWKRERDEMIDEISKREKQKALLPEPFYRDWPFQDAIQLLLNSGFAILDESRSALWKDQAWTANRPTYHQCYVWTDLGREACWRWQHSTPMSWAEQIQKKTARHCIVCGRDCFRKKVWANEGNRRCVCMACGALGHGLQDF